MKQKGKFNQTEQMCMLYLGTVLFFLAASFLLAWTAGLLPVPLPLRLVLSETFVVLPSLFFLRRRHLSLHQVNRPDRHLEFLSFLLMIPTSFFLAVTVSFISFITALPFGNGAADSLKEAAAWPTALNVVTFAVFPALVEETVFRSILFRGLRKHGFWKAALISSLFFGLLHMNINQFSYAFVLGVVFCLLREATGSFWSSVMAHFCINFFSVLSLRQLTEGGSAEISLSSTASASVNLFTGSLLFIAAVICFALVLLNLWLIAGIHDRLEYMAWLFRGGERKYLRKLPREKLACPALALAVVVPSGFLLLLQFVF